LYSASFMADDRGRDAAGALGAVDVARAALLALADLSPKPAQRGESLAVPLDWFRWLDGGLTIFDEPMQDAGNGPLEVIGRDVRGYRARRQFGGDFAPLLNAVGAADAIQPTIQIDRSYGERLAAIQQVRSIAPLRVGWLFVAGTTELADAQGNVRRRRVFHPLVSRRVWVDRFGSKLSRAVNVVAAGDAELSPLIPSETARRELPEGPQYGGGALTDLRHIDTTLFQRLAHLRRFAIAAANAAGLPATEFVLERASPEELMRHRGLRIVVGLAMYCVDDTDAPTRSNSLRVWADRARSVTTAFDRIYGDAPSTAIDDTTERATLDGATVDATLPLNHAQIDAVRTARAAGLSVISGAPGTGKSHTVSAIVTDALRRGQRVLVTARTDAAVDALIDLFERQPGVDPVVFGSNERRERLAHRLAAGQLRPATDEQLAIARQQLDDAIASRDAHRAHLRAALRAEEVRTSDAATVESVRSRVPALADPAVDLDALSVELTRVRAPVRGRWRRRRQRARARRLLARLGAGPDVALTDLAGTVDLLRHLRAPEAPDLLGDRYRTLEQLEQRVRTALGAWLGIEARSSDRLDRRGLMAIAALATALRSGREARKAQLERLDEARLTHALPLWIGTLGDVDDLLPPTPALFDLVVVDEAASIEQALAAPALLRAGRAVVSGDPRQLRHVSFVSDEMIESVLAAHGLSRHAAASRLDVRRNSIFDAAASAAPVCVLDEHQRSDPHLIDVVAERLYRGELTIATRSPITDSHDCVHLVRSSGVRDDRGVVRVEIDAIVRELQRLLEAGVRSVGVITPFRPQADAIEERVLAMFDVASLERLDLRIATVHGMQGNERDIVLCSLGLGPNDRAAARFVEDPHLLAVMLTRARTRMVMYTSFEPQPGSLLAEYFARADQPPGPPPAALPLAAWQQDVLDELERAGVQATRSYPVGSHVVDAATRVGNHAVAIVLGIDRRGADAHIERHLALIRRGWVVCEVLQSTWNDQPAGTILQLTDTLRAQRAQGSTEAAGGTLPG